MDLELQKQFVEILKTIKDQANPTFQELVRQYQGLHFWAGMALTFLALIFGFLSYQFLSRIKDLTPFNEGNLIGAGFAFAFFGLLSAGCATCQFLTSFYPLASLL